MWICRRMRNQISHIHQKRSVCNMNMLNEKLAERSAKLAENNLFSQLDFQCQEEIKSALKENVDALSKSIEGQLNNNTNSKSRILVKYNDFDSTAMTPQARSDLLEGEYIGVIRINIGLIIHLYEMLYGLDYKIFVPDGKNIENIKMMLFYTSINIILFHEVAHIYYQHGLLKQELVSQFGESSQEYILDMQTLEYDADAFAITKIYEFISSLQKLSTTAQSKLYYQIFIFSIHSLVFLFRQVNEFDDVTDHPASYIRELAMLKVANNLFSNQHAQIYIDFAEKEFNKQFNIDDDKLNSYFEKMGEFCIQLSDIEKNYVKLMYSIKKYSRLPVEGVDYPDYRNL